MTPTNPLPERIPTEIEILKRELEIEKRRNIDLDHQYHTELGQCQYFLKIHEDKVKDERKQRVLLFKDFKKLGIKNKRLEDDLKSKKGNPSKRIKLTKSTQKELKEAQKQTKEQRKELKGKMAEERQVWENKHKANTKEQSREITELKFKLRVEKIERAELRVENQSVRNAIRAMEQSLREHKDYIVEHQEDSVRQIVEYDRALIEAWKDRKDWRAQCLAKQLYIKHTIK